MFRLRYLMSALVLLLAVGASLSYEDGAGKDGLRACRGGDCTYNVIDYIDEGAPCGWGLTNRCGQALQNQAGTWYCRGENNQNPYCTKCGPSTYDEYFGAWDPRWGFFFTNDGSQDCTDWYLPGCEVQVINGVHQCVCKAPGDSNWNGKCQTYQTVNCPH